MDQTRRTGPCQLLLHPRPGLVGSSSLSTFAYNPPYTGDSRAVALTSGSKLGPYEILGPLGAGGMGEVYRAKDTRLGRTVAIKVLPGHLSASPERRKRLEREARAISSLSHPHICTLYDVGQHAGVDFLVMEHLEGETLARRLRSGPLPLDQALGHAAEIADALDKAHRQGVVHRDLKPGNVMLTKSGATLLDFGLAKLRGAGVEGEARESALPTEERPLTEEGTILGTYPYMSPEQLEGKEADARTDIFAFGAVLYEMVTGKRAFEGKSRASLIAAAVGGALGAWLLRPSPSPEVRTVTRFVMNLPPGGVSFALSPDGTRLAYSARVGDVRQLHLRAMDSLEATPLPGTEGARAPFFSPDGEWLGFEQGAAIRKVPVAGGEPETVCDECAADTRGLTWGPDDTIVFTPTVDVGGVWAVSADGGAPQPLTQVGPGETNHRWAQLLPRGEVLLFTAGSDGDWGNSAIVVQRLDSGERKTLARGATYGRYLPTGHLVYLRQGTLLAAPFDLARLELGAEVRVAEGISQHPSSGAPRLGLSDAGVLVYVTEEFGDALDTSSLAWVDRNGAVQPLEAPPRPYLFFKLSPEGERVAVGITGARSAVWVYDIPTGSLNSLTFESDGASSIPVWVGGGDRIAFLSQREGPRNLFWKAVDFGSPAQRLTESRKTHYASSASHDGKWLAYTEYDPASPRDGDLVVLSLDGDPTGSVSCSCS